MTPDRWRLLVRASIALTAASVAVALLPFRTAVRLGSVPLGRRGDAPVTDCVWAVEAAARRLPWRTMCIEQGLAVQRMLRRGGVDAVLRYGACHDAAGKLHAHVWVTVGPEIILGVEEASGHSEIASFP